ncbi:MAG: peptidoglycan/LPS O-acetylase OafA/YrhL [Candidatus Azotimanducaceae bacterium]|jgi:peptidoglycan/LPS O-acetylase OafA/YrhL
MNERLRFYDIDGLKFFAAIMVVFYHYTFRGYAADGMSPMPFDSLSGISRYGYLGVDLFFIISGFVIMLSAQNGQTAKFVVSRMVRIYPAFWVGVCMTALVMTIYAKPPFTITVSQWLFNLPLIGSFVGVEYVDSVYWSLLVELKFYFLVFVLMCFGLIHRSEYFFGGWLIISLAIQSHDITQTPLSFKPDTTI